MLSCVRDPILSQIPLSNGIKNHVPNCIEKPRLQKAARFSDGPLSYEYPLTLESESTLVDDFETDFSSK